MHKHKKKSKDMMGGGWASINDFKKEMGDDTNWEGVTDEKIGDMLILDSQQELKNKQFEYDKKMMEEQKKYSQLQSEKEQSDKQRQQAEINFQSEKYRSPFLHHTIYERRAPLIDIYDVNRFLRKENSRVTDQLEDEKRKERLEKEKLKEKLEKEKLKISLLKLRNKKTKSRSSSKTRSKSKSRSRSKSRSKSR
jgi:hypothetical protein